MFKNIVLVLVIFIIILLALSFGETAFQGLLAGLSALTGVLIENFDELLDVVVHYLQLNTGKVLIALLLTIPVSVWVLRSRRDTLATPSTQRKIAIILAVFLGWLGAHRFYLGQVGWGLAFLLMLYLFAPLAVILGLLDAVRYLFMDDEAFAASRLP